MDSLSPENRAETLIHGDPELLARLREGSLHDPHLILGVHPIQLGAMSGVVVRAFHPDALSCALLQDSEVRPMDAIGGGVFSAFFPDSQLPFAYRLRFGFKGGARFEREDPYRFLPTLGDLDLHLIAEGSHRNLWQVLGANVRVLDGVQGTSFAVWAPSARHVSVVGDFNGWDGRLLPMRALGQSGVWELFVPGVGAGALYRYEIRAQSGELRVKSDPLARAVELSPGTASRVVDSAYEWQDSGWRAARSKADIAREPVSIYEVHLGSWARMPEENDRMLSYRELAPRLVAHAKRLGFTHLELMPVAEHGYYPSWGYQVSAYYAPAARYGTPDDFKYFVDHCHQHGIGVIIDWVPAHFPKDDHALRRFDGSALYEHEDPRRGEHPDWGTLIFNLGRHEVFNFLTANALYWLKEFHVDGLRVDAVASMLYLDFSRKEGQWLPNQYGGRENLEAVAFLKAFNDLVHSEVPGAFTVAEESTAWGGITRPPSEGGLGFDFKWNMGWMHDTLDFFTEEPVHRKYHVDRLTFSMIYEYTERFINSISHDEVVYGKRSMLEKMPGDAWQKLANLRLLLAYQYTRPGKQLLFMGAELAQYAEWSFDHSLDWHLEREAHGRCMETFVAALGAMYARTPALWRQDPDPAGFEWIDGSDRDNTVISYLRKDGADHVVVVLNFTPVPRDGYRIGVPASGAYKQTFSSDDADFGGSGYARAVVVATEHVPYHGREHSIRLALPPLGALVFAPLGAWADPA
jgi:1,4-alpha-glucan branching enzyme